MYSTADYMDMAILLVLWVVLMWASKLVLDGFWSEFDVVAVSDPFVLFSAFCIGTFVFLCIFSLLPELGEQVLQEVC